MLVFVLATIVGLGLSALILLSLGAFKWSYFIIASLIGIVVALIQDYVKNEDDL